MINRSTLLAIAATLVLVVAIPSAVAGGGWPSRTVKIIVPFPAGNANDAAARIYADALSKRWGKPVIVENKPGADAIVGGAAFANARDDHTLLYGTASMITVNPLLQDALPYDPVRDLIPISSGASAILLVAVHAGLPASNLQELAQFARTKPGILTWGSGPSLPYFAFAAMVKRNRLDMIFVPYRDAAAPQSDLGEGRLHIWSTALQAIAGPVAAGKVRILAVTSPQREQALPEVPTVAEAGFPEMEIEGLSGLFGWRDMPTGLHDRISADMQAIARDLSVRSRIEASGQRVLGGTPAEFAVAIERQRTRVQEITRIVDLKAATK